MPAEVVKDITICFVHFRTLNLQHLDAAWYSLSRQDFTRINSVVFLDNNTLDSPEEIQEVLYRYPLPVPLILSIDKHGDSRRTHSWSVNRVSSIAFGPAIFFTRSDYILSFECINRCISIYDERKSSGTKPFISGWCWQMAYDREARNIDAVIDIEQYNWRQLGMQGLLQHPFAFRFHETDLDAGVWLTEKSYLLSAGWMNEDLVSWGYQQSTFQRALSRVGVRCEAIQDYLFAHQHHYADRNFSKASSEYGTHGKGL